MRPVVATALFVSLLPAAACKKEKPVAPTEMTEILTYMFVNWEDEEKLAAASDNLKPWLDDNATSEQTIDGYQLSPLDPEDIGDSVIYPADAAFEEQLGAAGGNVSSFPLDAQTEHMVVADQVFANEKSYNQYDRTISEGNAASFKKGSGVLRTDNEVSTQVLIYEIPYDLKKDYRWIEGESSRSIIARSWIEEEGCNEGGGTCLLQSFSVDVFMDDGEQTQRLTATWAQTKPSLGDDFMVDSLADGLQDVFEGTDLWMEENL
jgi:hypothetical protein